MGRESEALGTGPDRAHSTVRRDTRRIVLLVLSADWQDMRWSWSQSHRQVC